MIQVICANHGDPYDGLCGVERSADDDTTPGTPTSNNLHKFDDYMYYLMHKHVWFQGALLKVLACACIQTGQASQPQSGYL